MFLSSCLGVLFAGSPFFTSLGGTPRPIAFRLRGQDPCADLGPGWFAMGPRVCLRVTFLFFFFGLCFPPPPVPLLLLPLLLFCRRRSFCGVAFFFFLLFCCCVAALVEFFCCGGCAWGVLFCFFFTSLLLKRVCPSPTCASQHANSPLSLVFCRSALLFCLSSGMCWFGFWFRTRRRTS